MKAKVFFGVAVITLLMTATFLNSCKKENPDPCEGVTCLNGGYCTNGECVCPQGYGGADCSQQITPSKIRITKIEVTRFPATNSGAGWDLSSGPDIYPELSKSSYLLWRSSIYYQNADPSVIYSFEINPVVDLNQPNDQYSITLYDYDDFSASDFMGRINFTPYWSNNGFPSIINIDAGGAVAFRFYVTYVW